MQSYGAETARFYDVLFAVDNISKKHENERICNNLFQEINFNDCECIFGRKCFICLQFEI